MATSKKKISVKDAFGGSLFLAGFILMLIGFSKSGGDVYTFTYEGFEQTLRNINADNLNWRVFFGGVFMFFGLALYIFPSQAAINKETGWKPLGMD